MIQTIQKHLVLLLLVVFAAGTAQSQQTILQYLSGTDKDHTVKWDFMVTSGRKSGQWGTIPVPSCWETQGYGTYSYSQDPKEADEKGFYKFNFTVAPQHKGKKVFIVFEAAMTETTVKINGKPAGPVHQGGFYEFRYDVGSLLNYGAPNTLEVTVSKKSTNNSINRAERQADFWLFGGIFRPVYLAVYPTSFIERVAVDARADGNFNMQVFQHATAGQTIEAQVFDLKGRPVDDAFPLQTGDSMLRHHFTGIKQWNPEEPNLYNVNVYLKEGSKVIHTVRQRFGFRTAELRPEDGFYVNGKKVIFKGVCRHSEWPETGRTLSRSIHLLDIATMKGMNMNAVRMSHYPPDREFLDLCDSLGLFVLDELTGWQKSYDTATARRLVKELIVRDVNHPSIVIWDNGNEGGWNRSVDNDYQLYDPQKRLVIHPWERFNGTNTKHYPDFKYVQNEVANAKEVFFPTEFMHGLFDGGHGAALEDFWSLMMQHPHAAGGFLWSLFDEGLVRQDRGDSIDVAGNAAPDGIVGPHREREGSFYTIRELWSPVSIAAPAEPRNFTGTLEVENRYLYTNLNTVRFEWSLLNFAAPSARSTAPAIIQKGTVQGPALAPGEKGTLAVPLPAGMPSDAFTITAFNAKGDTLNTWTWLMRSPGVSMAGSRKEAVVKEDARSLTVTVEGVGYVFDKASGFLQKVTSGARTISLSGGPALAGSLQPLSGFRHARQGNQYVVEPSYAGDSIHLKWIFEKGLLPKLEYSYTTRDTVDYMGITFRYPEEKITGIRYLGKGPYRVWKNRLKGPQPGVWQKAYNNTITGETWLYPEFKGYFADLYWMQLQTTEGSFVVYTAQPGTYLQVLKPERPKGAGNNNTNPPFPDAGIGFLQAIPAIGTKFNRPEVMGPQSQRTGRPGNVPVTGTLYFDFR